MGQPEHEQCRGPPAVPRWFAPDRQLGVPQHLVGPTAAHHREDDRPLRLERRRSITGDAVEGRALGDLGHPLRLIRATVEEVDPPGDDRERRVALEEPGVELPQPTVEGGGLRIEQRQRGLREVASSVEPLAAGDGVGDRPVGDAGGGVPGGGAPVEHGELAGLAARELAEEVLPQQVVVPERRLAETDLLDQQVPAGDRADPLTGVGQAADRFGDARRDRLQDRGAGEDGHIVVVERAADLESKVGGDVAFVARHARERSACAVARPTRQQCEVRPSRPAFGLLRKLADVGRAQLEPRLGGQRGRFGLVQGQQSGPDLQEVPVGAEPGERKVRLGPAGQRHSDSRRQVVEEGAERIERDPVDQAMDVVEDEHRRPSPAVELGGEGGHGRPKDPFAGGQEPGPDRRVDRLDPVEGDREVRQHDAGIVVEVVERKPGDGPWLAGRPLGEQRRLAVPRRADDRHDGRARLGEQVEERGPLDRTAPGLRGPELGLDDGNGGPKGRCGSGHRRQSTTRVSRCRDHARSRARPSQQGDHTDAEVAV